MPSSTPLPEQYSGGELEGNAARLKRARWTWVVAGLPAAYLVGVLGAVALRGLGWWTGAPWERAVLVWAHGTVSPWLDPLFLVMPVFGTNYTLVPVVALAALWLWRPPARIGSYALALVGAVIGGGAVVAIYRFVLTRPVPIWLTAGLAATGAAGLYVLDRRRRDRPARPVLAVHLVVAQLGSWVLNPALKLSLGRPRPTLFEPRGQHDLPAYPSGHAVAVSAVMLTAAYLIHRTGHGRWAYWVVGVLFLLNSYSRVYLSVHWPTDLVGGTVVGLAWMLALVLAFRPAYRSAADT